MSSLSEMSQFLVIVFGISLVMFSCGLMALLFDKDAHIKAYISLLLIIIFCATAFNFILVDEVDNNLMTMRTELDTVLEVQMIGPIPVVIHRRAPDWNDNEIVYLNKETDLSWKKGELVDVIKKTVKEHKARRIVGYEYVKHKGE